MSLNEKVAAPFSKKKTAPISRSFSEVRVRLGVIGYGYWGPNLVRNFQDITQSKVVAVADLEENVLKSLGKKFTDLRLTTRHWEILRDPSIDAVVIATPVSTHYALASEALRFGKHVLVEKPLAATSREAVRLTRLAREKKKILMAGHTFEYNPAVQKIGEILRSGELGKLHYVDCVRVNLGRYQSDGRNVIWDLAPHDFSIILNWFGKLPTRVSAWGNACVRGGVEDVAFIRLEFPGGVFVHTHVSWLSPAKIRRITVVGSKKMILYDDLENFEKIKIMDRGAELKLKSAEVRVDYRLGDIVSPHLDMKEPLRRECEHFIDCILEGRTPLTDGDCGGRVVKVLEAASRSLKQGGRPISL